MRFLLRLSVNKGTIPGKVTPTGEHAGVCAGGEGWAGACVCVACMPAHTCMYKPCVEEKEVLILKCIFWIPLKVY